MLQSAVITLREGLEAFLIVAITLTYLRKTGRAALASAVDWGVVARWRPRPVGLAPLSGGEDRALGRHPRGGGRAAGGPSLTIHMWRIGKRMRQHIHDAIDRSVERAGSFAWLGVFGFTVLMITREGMETAILFNAILFQLKSAQLLVGAIADPSRRH